MALGTGNAIDNYKILENLGKSSSDPVYSKIRLPSKLRVSIKVIQRASFSKEELPSFENEIKMALSFHHPFLAEFLDFFETDLHYFIVMEYLPNGSLFHYIQKQGKLEEKHARGIFMQILSALQYLHQFHKIMNHNLNPKNILLDEYYNIRLIIFESNQATQICHSTFTPQSESHSYLAPKLF
jgi:serine/threonine protein kinase